MEPKPTAHHLLESDHVELDCLLKATMAAIESADAVRTYEQLDFFWARLAMHIRSEHLRFFPAVREIAEKLSPEFSEIPEMLQALRHDHDFFMRDLARAIKAMRLVFYFGNEAETFVVVRELLIGVKERLTVHNQLEEQKVYTLATERFLGPEAMENLLSKVQNELDTYPKRFATGYPYQ